MTTKKMLIDASHPEETRVAIVSGHHLEDFDVEVESRRQLRGNIYLAKVTRVEPSLQAAFVDFGGNRHGFLAFTEIHPDYYQIPIADREKLIAEQQVAETEAEDNGDDEKPASGEDPGVEMLGGDSSEEVEVRRPAQLRRRYKIQEVIKRRQVLLVQVVKEERGTKGAALTTYLSLAGRYCVLMPNTARGGGISRKISNSADRKRLKTILTGLDIPGVMAVIVRTAGQKRSKAEIKRDYEYLMRLWESVREVTLESMAPCLVHEEGNLIKRSIRDLYDKDIEEIIIAGDAGYRTAKDFMKLLIPSHTKRVQPYKETNKQLFQHYHVESQLDSMHSPEVQLKSGGYIVINPTEALVSIDVNSGRATRGRNIEETAQKTNLEASDEIARQLRLRDLSGLIVIDFIDMEEGRNKSKVERRLKDVMRSDRARIQIGRISPFGLMEMSRQRMRPSLIETSSDPCPYCEGTGTRRSTDSATLHLLRAVEEEGMQHRSKAITVYVPTAVALHVLNNQRDDLMELESKYGLSITLENDDTLIPPAYRIERFKDEAEKSKGSKGRDSGDGAQKGRRPAEDGSKRRRRRGRRRPGGGDDAGTQTTETETVAAATGEGAAKTSEAAAPDRDGEKSPERAKRRRRGRRGGRRRGRKPAEQKAQEGAEMTAPEASEATAGETASNVIPIETAQEAAPPPPDDGKAAGAEKTDAKEIKKPAKRTRAPRAKKPDAAPEKAAKRKKAAKDKPEAPQPPAPSGQADAPKAGLVAAPEPSAPEPAAPAAAPAKTQVISVDDTPDKGKAAAKPARKGWWSQS